jgi:carbonic anhydrase/acetyltransferase-like protein (isoleucine patch superfamily)
VDIIQWAYDHFMRLFVGTSFLPAWYRMLGAKMGRDVRMGDMDVLEDPHLVTVGDKAALIDNAVLDTHSEPGDGYAYTGRIEVGPHCIVGARSVLASGVQLSLASIVMPHTYMPPNARLEESAVMSGVPATSSAKRSTIMTEADPPSSSKSKVEVGYLGRAAEVVSQLFWGFVVPMVSCFVVVLLLLTASYPSIFLVFWAMDHDGLNLSAAQALSMLPIAFVGYLLCMVITVALHKWVLRWRQRGGSSMPLGGLFYHLRANALVLQSYSGLYSLDTLRGTVFAPIYLRLLGAPVSPSAYIGTFQVRPSDD